MTENHIPFHTILFTAGIFSEEPTFRELHCFVLSQTKMIIQVKNPNNEKTTIILAWTPESQHLFEIQKMFLKFFMVKFLKLKKKFLSWNYPLSLWFNSKLENGPQHLLWSLCPIHHSLECIICKIRSQNLVDTKICRYIQFKTIDLLIIRK